MSKCLGPAETAAGRGGWGTSDLKRNLIHSAKDDNMQRKACGMQIDAYKRFQMKKHILPLVTSKEVEKVKKCDCSPSKEAKKGEGGVR